MSRAPRLWLRAGIAVVAIWGLLAFTSYFGWGPLWPVVRPLYQAYYSLHLPALGPVSLPSPQLPSVHIPAPDLPSSKPSLPSLGHVADLFVTLLLAPAIIPLTLFFQGFFGRSMIIPQNGALAVLMLAVSAMWSWMWWSFILSRTWKFIGRWNINDADGRLIDGFNYRPPQERRAQGEGQSILHISDTL